MRDVDTKPWWLSKTILAGLGILIVTVLSFFGLATGEGDGAAISEAVGQIATAVLALIAIYGRIAAEQKIT